MLWLGSFRRLKSIPCIGSWLECLSAGNFPVLSASSSKLKVRSFWCSRFVEVRGTLKFEVLQNLSKALQMLSVIILEHHLRTNFKRVWFELDHTMNSIMSSGEIWCSLIVWKDFQSFEGDSWKSSEAQTFTESAHCLKFTECAHCVWSSDFLNFTCFYLPA